MGQAGRLIIRQAMRDNEHSSVGMPRVKKVNGQFDEVIPIARHKETVFNRSIAQLGLVIESISLYLVHTHDIEAQTPTDLRHRRVDILVQQETHRSLRIRGPRDSERQFAADPFGRPLVLACQPCFNFIGIECIIR
jgi:hypothetical protein